MLRPSPTGESIPSFLFRVFIMLLPLQGVTSLQHLPRALPWAKCRLPFQGALLISLNCTRRHQTLAEITLGYNRIHQTLAEITLDYNRIHQTLAEITLGYNQRHPVPSASCANPCQPSRMSPGRFSCRRTFPKPFGSRCSPSLGRCPGDR